MSNCNNCKHLKSDPYLVLDDGTILYTFWCEKDLIRPSEIEFNCKEFSKIK